MRRWWQATEGVRLIMLLTMAGLAGAALLVYLGERAT